MGAIRGKRNRDQDRYWHERRKATQSGMVGTAVESCAACQKCGLLVPHARIHKGWCLECVSAWAESTDPWLIYQAQSQLPAGVVIASRLKQIERLQEKVIEPIPDEAFLPLTQFMGARGVGAQRTWWNTLYAAYALELTTTGQLAKLGHNTMHLCGRHAPVQRLSFQGFLSRIKSAGGDFKLFQQEPRFLDYVRGFINDNRLLIFAYQKTSVDVYAREDTRRFEAKYGKSHFDKHAPAYWPFESHREAFKREHALIEQLPDVVMDIGGLVPKNIPETLREDLCQDLCVAVLSGETTLENLRNEKALKYYISAAFKLHPLRYGRYSLDCAIDKNSDERGDRKIVGVTYEDVSPDRADRGWLESLCVDPDAGRGWNEARERPHGLATLGDVARANNDGHAIDGPDVIAVDDHQMDEDLAEVYFADQHPQWRRKLSD